MGAADAQGAWAARGLPVVGMAACYEEMNYSIFGPVVFNCAAPDDGNMIVLNKVGDRRTEAALAAADRRRQGALVDRDDRARARRRLRSDDDADHRARSKGDNWVIHGRKWFITGAGVAQHFILIAKTSDDSARA